MNKALERVEKLETAKQALVAERCDHADAQNGEGVARLQIAIEAVDRAIDDERVADDDPSDEPAGRTAIRQSSRWTWFNYGSRS